MSLPLYSSAGYAIIAAVGAIVVIILGFIASLIARSGEMGMTIRRKQMLAFSEVKLEVGFINKTGKNLECGQRQSRTEAHIRTVGYAHLPG